MILPDGVSLILTSLDNVNMFNSIMTLAIQLRHQMFVELLVIDHGENPYIEQFIDQCKIEEVACRCVRCSKHKGFAIDVCVILATYQWILVLWDSSIESSENFEALFICFKNDPDLTIAGIRTKNPDTIHWNDLLALAETGYNPFDGCHILLKKDIFMLIGGCPMEAFSRDYADAALWKIWLRFFKGVVLTPETTVFKKSNGAFTYDPISERSDPTALTQSSAIELIAKALNVSSICAGKLSYLAWNYYDYILADDDLLPSLKKIFPDRPVLPPADVEDHLADRFLWFSWKGCTGDNRVHYLEKLMDILNKCLIQ